MIRPTAVSIACTDGMLTATLTFDGHSEAAVEAVADVLEPALEDRGFDVQLAGRLGERVLEVETPALWEPLLTVVLLADHLKQIFGGKPVRVPVIVDPDLVPREAADLEGA